MATTTLRINLNDVNAQFFKELKASVGNTAQVEIKVEDTKHGEGLFSEDQFWSIIDLLDWQKKQRAEIMVPAVSALSKMPVSSIYLFQDMLSEKLYQLDTRRHADAYLQKQEDGDLSMDDFLYVRCAVVAEGKVYYAEILANPSAMPADIDFEHLFSLAGDAYKLKTGREFVYSPLFNYETKSNTDGWKN